MASHDIVVIGASAGGIPALKTLVAALPADYPGVVLVVVHLSSRAPSRLAMILAGAGPLPAVTAEDGMVPQPGNIYVAPTDHHLLLERHRLRTVRGPRENRHRPAIDPLFRSAAWAYGPRVVGVVLTGNLDDGSAGLWAIKSCGGVTVVQDPLEADHPEMPMNALLHAKADYRLSLPDIAGLLARLVKAPVEEAADRTPPDTIGVELEAVKLNGDVNSVERLGALSPFTCPACRGALWEIEQDGDLRYRCHVGHAFSVDSLLADQNVAVEQSIFVALRAVEEKSTALRRLAARWPEEMPGVKADYETRARELDNAASTLKSILGGIKG